MISICCRRDGDLYKLSLQFFLSSGPVPNIGCSDMDDLDYWHQSMTDTSHWAICEAARNKLVEGVVLDQN